MKPLWKAVIKRGINSFMYSVATTAVFYTIFMMLRPSVPPMLPEYMIHFSSVTYAMLVQLILVGFMSVAFGAGSVIMELERLPLVIQSILYFILTTVIWFPIANFCWHFTDYPQAFIGILVSYIASYIISWTVQYRICCKNIVEINRRLEQIRNDECNK